MSEKKKLSRRDFLRGAGLTGLGLTLTAAGCQPKTVVVEKEVEKVVTQVVEVEKVVKETVVVEGTPVEVTRVVKEEVEKVVTATPEPPRAQEPVTLRYSTWMGPPRLEYVEQIIANFEEEYPWISVEIEQLGWSDYWDKIQVEFAAGDAPDVFWGSGSYFVNFVQKGMLLDTTPFIERDGLDMSKFYGQDLVIGWEGKTYGMHFGTGGVVLYYNKAMFDEAGLDYPAEDWTWTDVREAATVLTQDKDGDGRTDQWGIQVSNSSESGWGPFVLSNGGQWINDERTKTVLDSEEAIQAMDWILTNICELGIQPKSGEVTLPPGVSSAFAGGIIGMQIGGTWNIRVYKQIETFEWDIAPIPLSPYTNKRMTTFNANPNWAFAGTKHPEEAWLLLKWFVNEESQRIIGEGEIKIPQLKSVANDIRGFAGPPPEHKKYALELFDYAHDLWFHERSAEHGSVIGAELDYGFLCEKSAEEACIAATEAGDQVLAAAR